MSKYILNYKNFILESLSEKLKDKAAEMRFNAQKELALNKLNNEYKTIATGIGKTNVKKRMEIRKKMNKLRSAKYDKNHPEITIASIIKTETDSTPEETPEENTE